MMAMFVNLHDPIYVLGSLGGILLTLSDFEQIYCECFVHAYILSCTHVDTRPVATCVCTNTLH